MEIPSTIFLTFNSLKYTNYRQIASMFLSMAVTISIGMFLIVVVDPRYIRIELSILVLFLVLLLASGWTMESKVNFFTVLLSGFSGGILQGTAGMSGPPIVSVLLTQNETTDVSRGFMMSGVIYVSLLPQFSYGLVTMKLLLIDLTASILNNFFRS